MLELLRKRHILYVSLGEVAEWLNAHAWKACDSQGPGVRIPPSPLIFKAPFRAAGKLKKGRVRNP